MAIGTPKSICYLGNGVMVCKSVYCVGVQAGQGMFRSLMSQTIPVARTRGGSQVVSAQHRYSGSAGVVPRKVGTEASQQPGPSHAARTTS